MFNRNVPRWERVLRAIAGLVMVATGLFWLGSSPLGWAIGGSGIIVLATALAGYCPACAIAGRRIGPDH